MHHVPLLDVRRNQAPTPQILFPYHPSSVRRIHANRCNRLRGGEKARSITYDPFKRDMRDSHPCVQPGSARYQIIFDEASRLRQPIGQQPLGRERNSSAVLSRQNVSHILEAITHFEYGTCSL